MNAKQTEVTKIKMSVSGGGKDFQSSLIIDHESQIQQYFKDSVSFERLFICKFKGKSKLELTPKSDVFGRFLLNHLEISIYPKFVLNGDGIDYRVLTNLFFIGNDRGTKIYGDSASTNLIRSEVEELGLDFYFYMALKNILRAVTHYNKEIFSVEEQEVSGIKGKVDFAKTIQRFGGLQHKYICLVSETKYREFILGCIKSHVRNLLSCVSNERPKRVARKILGQLTGIIPIALNAKNLVKLRSAKAEIESESRRLGKIVGDICHALEDPSDQIVRLGSNGFMFDMDYYFEKLLDIYVRIAFKENGLSGNDKPLQFLHGCNSARGISDQEINRNMILKPDNYILDGLITRLVVDAKYKLVGGRTGKVVGIEGADLHQLATYWLHFLVHNGGETPPQLALVYPNEDPTSDIIEDLGTFRFEFELGHPLKIEYNIWKLNVFKALEGFEKTVSDKSQNSFKSFIASKMTASQSGSMAVAVGE